MAKQPNYHTIYHALDQKGIFSKNPANVDSRDPDSGEVLYKGPVRYPMMFYHPEGETRVIVAGSVEYTPGGVKTLGEQSEIIWQVARNSGEEKKLREAGWHDHPAKAMVASGLEAPAVSSSDRIRELEGQIERQREELEELRRNQEELDEAEELQAGADA